MHRNVTLLKWFNFFTDFRLYAPLAIIYFADVSGSYVLGMSVFSIIMLSSAVLEIPTGIFSDRIGRKSTIVLGAVASTIGVVLYAVGGSFEVLAIGAVFEGLSRSFYSGNNDALLYDTLKESGHEDQFGDYLGKTSAMFQSALASSALIGGLLAVWSFSLVLWMSAVAQFVCFLLSFQFIEPKIHSRKSGNIYIHLVEAFREFNQNRKLRLLSIASIMGHAFGEVSYQFQAAFFQTLWPVWAIGLIKSASNIGAGFSFHYGGKLVRKYGELKTLVVGNLYARFATALGLLFPTVLSPILLATPSLFFGVSNVAKGILVHREFKHEQRATMGSITSFAGSLTFAATAFIFGLVADLLSPRLSMLTLQVLMLPLIGIYIYLFKQSRSKS